MPKPKAHVFVCGQTRPDGHPRGSCGQAGASGVMQTFAEEVAKRNLFGQVSVVATGCLGPCHTGSNVLIYPGCHLYTNVDAEKAIKIIDEHILAEQPIEDWIAPDNIW